MVRLSRNANDRMLKKVSLDLRDPSWRGSDRKVTLVSVLAACAIVVFVLSVLLENSRPFG